MPTSVIRRVLAVSGTPGTGKSALVQCLSERINGSERYSVSVLAEQCNAIFDRPDRTGTRDVDIEMMTESWPDLSSRFSSDLVLIDGHLSHQLPIDGVILLRCRPDVLRGRLKMRGWANAKVEENVEAEFLGSIAADVLADSVSCFEVASHELDVMDISDAVIAWIEGGLSTTGPSLDWLEGVHR